MKISSSSGGVVRTGQPLLRVRDLHTHFFLPQGVGKAVNGVSFEVRRGETLGLVGESGCGKSITALSILRLLPPHVTRIVAGEIIFKGMNLLRFSEREIRGIRGRHISMILQDPMTALNPVFNIGEQILEAMRLHRIGGRQSLTQRAIALLQRLRVPAAESRLRSYPHEFSGGMRQRVVGAISLACEPELLIADEPTTSLDVTIQAQYLRLLRSLQQERGLGMIFITHDFGIVARMCDWVAVMYGGSVMEFAPMPELFREPGHPYTRALLRSLPMVGTQTRERLDSIEGHPPSIYALPEGCPFADRCEHVMDRCRAEFPPAVPVGRNHTVTCWLHA